MVVRSCEVIQVNIWVIGRNYPEKFNKMCGSFELEQAKTLEKYGQNVSYITCVFHPLYKVKKWGFCEWEEDVSVFAYSQFYAPQRCCIYWDSFKRKRWEELLKHVEDKMGIPDVIHVHYPTLITIPETILAYKKYGCKIIVTEHWTKVQKQILNRHEREQLLKYLVDADEVICVGTPLKESILQLYGKKRRIQVIPNMVPELFGGSADKHKGFHFIAVGRLVPVKQFKEIIEVFCQTFMNEKEVQLVIVGGGSEYRRLSRLIKKYNMEDQVILTGAKSREETSMYMKNADVLICFSRLETFGVPVIEAWYTGLPVIATEALGFLSYWRKNLGILVSSQDTQELKSAMLELRKNYDSYDKEQIQNYAKAHFSGQALYQSLMALYTN